MATKVVALAAQDTSGKLSKFEIERRTLGPKDVKVGQCVECVMLELISADLAHLS